MNIDYTKKLKFKGIKTPTDVLTVYDDATKVKQWFKRYYPGISNEMNKKVALWYKKQCDDLGKEWLKVADNASMKQFKKHWHLSDYKISGIGRDDFYEFTKNKLRGIVKEESFNRKRYYIHLALLPASEKSKILKA